MWPIPEENTGLVTFAEEILNGKFHLLWSVCFDFLKPVFNKQAVWSYEKVINGFMSLFNFYADSFQECKLQDILHITFFPAGEKVPSYTSKEKYDHLLSVKSFFQFGIQWENGWRVSPHIAVFSLIVGIWKPDKTRILVYFTKCECGY